jgi:hypothetical protein
MTLPQRRSSDTPLGGYLTRFQAVIGLVVMIAGLTFSIATPLVTMYVKVAQMELLINRHIDAPAHGGTSISIADMRADIAAMKASLRSLEMEVRRYNEIHDDDWPKGRK